jgi:hypothetical protein
MTPREIAEELVLKYHNLWINGNSVMAKQCALIAVDELIYETHFEVPNIRQRWWIEVKNEINKL